MANGIYKLAKENYDFPDILTDDIKVVLTRDYSPDFNTDEFLSDILLASRVTTSGNLIGKTFTLGVFDASNIVFSVVPAGDPCDYLIIYSDTGVAATSRLLCGLDTGIDGLPITPDGTNINVVWAAGGIFSL